MSEELQFNAEFIAGARSQSTNLTALFTCYLYNKECPLMQPDNSLSDLAIETAIYPYLLCVAPDTYLSDVFRLLSQVQGSRLPSCKQSLSSSWVDEVIASCVLVMEEMQSVKLLTNLNLLKLASGLNFAESGGDFAKSGGVFTVGVPPTDHHLFKTTDGVPLSDRQFFKTKVAKTDQMLASLITLRKSHLEDITVLKLFDQYRSDLGISRSCDHHHPEAKAIDNILLQPAVSVETDTVTLLQQEVSRLQAEKVQLQNRNAELTLSIQTERQERQKAEAALRKANQKLETKVEQRTSQLKVVNKQLQQEIAQHQQAKDALQRQLAAIEAASDGIAILNQNGEYTYLNSAHIKMFGYSDASELLGLTWRQYAQIEIEWFEQNVLPQLLQRGYWQGETTAKRKDGTTFAQEVSLTLLKDGGVICFCRDITKRKQAEEELRQALEREKELGELKSRFITMTSHEFRTPLTAILGSTELLRHYSHTWTDNKKLLYFNRIQANVQHLIQLLEDVLLLGKAEAKKLKFEPEKLDLVQLCRTLVAELQNLPGNKHTLVLISQCECADVYMDEQLLRHILGNLLSNAIKYSPIGSTIRFTLVCEDETAIFQIQDQGIGISQEDQEQMFESFYRGRNVGNVAGTGLGLTIVKKAVDLHGGEITVNSEVGLGTTFTVTIGIGTDVAVLRLSR